MKKKSKKIEPTKYLVLAKSYRSTKYITFGFDKYNDAKGFAYEVLKHGASVKVYKEYFKGVAK